MLMIQR